MDKDKKKYYVLHIIEVNGEYEYHQESKFRETNQESAERKGKELVSTWYATEEPVEPDEDGFYWFDEVAIKEWSVEEVSKEIYDWIR
jgi:hypothetical protein